MWSEYFVLGRWNFNTECSTQSLKSGRFSLVNIKTRGMIYADNLTSSLILCPLKPTPQAVGNSFNRSNLLQTHETIYPPPHHIFSPAILTEWVFEVVTLSKCDQKPECMPSGSLWKLHVLYMKMTYYFFFIPLFFSFPLLIAKNWIPTCFGSVQWTCSYWHSEQEPRDGCAAHSTCTHVHTTRTEINTSINTSLFPNKKCVRVCGGGSVKVIFVHHVSQADESSRDNPLLLLAPLHLPHKTTSGWWRELTDCEQITF